MLMATIVGPSPAEPTKESAKATVPSPDVVLRSFVKSDDGVPGVTVLAATRDRVIHQGAFGSFDPKIKDSAKIDTLFAIASMTKPVTSVAVMQLVEQGQLELDTGQTSADRS